jgi:hypothetical protein
MVPISGTVSGEAPEHYDIDIPIVFAKWVCVGCGKEVG